MPHAREKSCKSLFLLCVLVATLPLILISFGIPTVHSEDQTAVPLLGGLPSPQGITSNPQSAVFITLANGRITQLLAQNTAEPLAETRGRPGGLAFNAAGDLYVADAGRKAILRITPWGEISVLADQCDGKAFSAPERITVAPNGVVYFTDPDASRVYRTDAHGKTAVVVSDLRSPTGIVASADGDELFIADRARRIWRLRPDGTGRELFATLEGEGQPAGIARDEKGNLYVARDGGGKISVLNAEGKLVASYSIPGRRVSDVAFGGLNLTNLYVTESDTGTIYRLRVPNRSQRLPWEPDEPLLITAPVDGAILNHNDGEVTPSGLRITVEGTSRLAGPVRINGVSVPVHEGRFQNSLVLSDRETKIMAEARGRQHQIRVLWDRDSFKRYRFSTDDNILFLKDIAQHSATYSSIFENPYLALWREMHFKYGAKVHFNIYYETEGFTLSQMPDKFRPEWQKNAAWIRLTFHARANDPDRPYLHASAEKVRQDYRLVTREIARFAGPEVLSPVTTIHWGEITREAARALHEEGVRVLVGYFTACDNLPCVCFYLPLARWRYLMGRDYWKDTREDLTFIRHDIVINTVPLDKIVPHLEQVAADPHQAEIMELMIHEQYFYSDYRAYEPDYRQRVERALDWVTQHGYKSVFYDEGFLGAPAGK
jgi:sugar lactone lactonase YvrE